MNSRVCKKYSANVIGILDISDGKILVEIEDRNEPVDLAELFADFDGKDVAISINYKFDV